MWGTARPPFSGWGERQPERAAPRIAQSSDRCPGEARSACRCNLGCNHRRRTEERPSVSSTLRRADAACSAGACVCIRSSRYSYTLDDIANASEALICTFHTGQLPAIAVEKFMALIAFHKANLIAAAQQRPSETYSENAKLVEVPTFDPFEEAATNLERDTGVKIKPIQPKAVH